MRIRNLSLMVGDAYGDDVALPKRGAGLDVRPGERRPFFVFCISLKNRPNVSFLFFDLD